MPIGELVESLKVLQKVLRRFPPGHSGQERPIAVGKLEQVRFLLDFKISQENLRLAEKGAQVADRNVQAAEAGAALAGKNVEAAKESNEMARRLVSVTRLLVVMTFLLVVATFYLGCKERATQAPVVTNPHAVDGSV